MTEENNFTTQYLLKKGIITKEHLTEAREEHERTNRKIEEVLIKRGFVREEEMAMALADELGFAFVDLYSYQIEPAAAALLPAATALRFKAIPIFRIENTLTVAMLNPLDVEAIDEISRSTGGQLQIKPIVAAASGIEQAIRKQYGQEAMPQAAPAAAEITQVAGKPQAPAPEKIIEEAAQGPVIEIVNKLIEDAVKADASDIHLEPEKNAFYCRFRIDGILHDVAAPQKDLQLAVISRIKIMADMDIAQSRLPQDGRIETEVSGRRIDLRIATFPTIYGEHISIRILDKTQGIVKLEDLGFQPDTMKKFKEIIQQPYGLILVVGPTGSGKTTTLYSVLNTINSLKKNIITLEDPVEYTIPRIHQSQVNIKAGLTFAAGLRSILRVDPDIIMIGEIRDKETAEIAIHSSLTGHLVFSTLHTNDAPSAAGRLIDIGVEPYLLSSSLVGILAQRLVRKLCPKCKKGTEPVGCKHCHNTGYKGRTGIFELLIPNDQIKEQIVKKSPSYKLKTVAQKAGLRTLHEDGMEKVKQGITSLAEVLRVTEEV